MKRLTLLTLSLVALFMLVIQPVQSQHTTGRKMDELTMIQEQVAEIRKQTLKRVRQNPEFIKHHAETGLQSVRMDMALQDSVFDSINSFLDNYNGSKNCRQIDSLRIDAYAVKGMTKARLLADRVRRGDYVEYSLISLLPEIPADLNRPSNQLVKSQKYLDFLIARAFVHTVLDKGRFNTKLDTYPMLNEINDGLLRDAVVYRLLMESYPQSDLARWTDFAEDAVSGMSESSFRELLTDKLQRNGLGVKCYDFALPDVSGKIVRLKDLRGKVVIVDYWFTGCSACRDLNTKMKDIAAVYESAKDVVFVSISVDKKKETWLEGVTSGKYTHRESLNLFTDGLGTSHPVVSHYDFKGFPSLLLIDKDGCLAGIPPRPDDASGSDRFAEMIEQAR